MYCYIKSFQIQKKSDKQLMRSFDETIFIIVAYVNCALKVNANEVLPDQVDVE